MIWQGGVSTAFGANWRKQVAFERFGSLWISSSSNEMAFGARFARSEAAVAGQ